jgi:hypothetical protein
MKLRFVLAFAFLLLVSSRSYATPVCATGTLANVIAIGSCTIGDATFTFGPPALAGHPVWDNGPYVGDSYNPLGPSAAQVTFTPLDVANKPSFNLAGNFTAMGGYSCKWFSTCSNGNFYDEQFGYFGVDAPAGSSLVGSGLQLFGAEVTQGASAQDPNWNNHVSVNLVAGDSRWGIVNGEGYTQLTDSGIFAPMQHITALSHFRTWNRSGSSSSVSKFTSVTFSFDEQGPQQEVPPVSAVPEPTSMLLLGSGLIAAARNLKQRKS